MSAKIRTAILISGRGSNMEALINASKNTSYPAEIVLVISNRLDAAGLEKARGLGVKAICIDHKAFESRESFEQEIHDALIDEKVELVCCAGFMRVLTQSFVKKWHHRLVNIHPSLLPKYKGLNTHQRALDNGDKIHGCTVHYVSEELDSGTIIAQSQIDIGPQETSDSLAGRLLAVECQLYPEALKKVCVSFLRP
jgi:phosphoribosylglycinamide formyltransferase-1